MSKPLAVPRTKSDAMARQMAKATAEADKGAKGGGWASKAASGAGTASTRIKGTGAPAGQPRVPIQAKVAGKANGMKPAMAKKPAAAALPKSATTGPTPDEMAKRHRDAHFRALVDPAAQEERKRQHLESFRKLKAMPMMELQVEFIVCIRAEHYKDALMYSEILLDKDPNNALVQQFQPLLASMAVQSNERLCESSGSDSDATDGEGSDDGFGEGGVATEGAADGVKDESDSDSDDPETAWMWSDTWRTDPDDEPAEAHNTKAEK